MPNPFFKTQLKTSREAPDRFTPIPDAVVESKNNRPYIGNVDHGVDADFSHFNDALTTDINDGSDDNVEYEVEQEESPIPVRIVSGESSQEIKGFRVYRTYAPIDIPNAIVNRQDNRTGIKIKNLGDNRVWLGESANTANPAFGYPLDPGSEASFTSTQAIYGVTERLRPAAKGGWYRTIPRRTFNGNESFTDSYWWPAQGYTTVRGYLRVYSATGTTPSITGGAFAQMPDSGFTLANLGSATRTFNGASTYTADVSGTDIVRFNMSTSAASADSVIDAEMWIYAIPVSSATSADPTPLAVEADFTVTV
jgi:hypothetical protein